MLAKANRVVRADDYRRMVRRGRRVGTPHTLIYVAGRSRDEPTRVGFIVAKSVGNAVARNLVTRRLRSIGHDVVLARPTGTDIVIRALPGTSEVAWATLHSEILSGLDRSTNAA